MEGTVARYDHFSFLQIKIPILACIAILTLKASLFAQCVDTADFNDWNGAGQSWQSWSVLSANVVREVDESIPPLPNFFISDQDYMDIRFAFDAVVQVTGDDDFFGIVMGFKNPVGTGTTEHKFILFDWKSKEEVAFSYTAEEGYSLAEFHGSIENYNLSRYFWGHNGYASNSTYDYLAKNYGPGKGWLPMTSYHFEVTYTAGKISVEVNGNKVFDINRCNQPGRIGFYTYSQHDVIFSNLTIVPEAYANFHPLTICAGDSVFYTMDDEQCGGHNPSVRTWLWDFGDGNYKENNVSGYHTYWSSGEYTINYTATFESSCTDTITALVRVQEPIFVYLGRDTTLAVNSTITLVAGPPEEGWIYEWPDGSGLNTVTVQLPPYDTTIWVIATKGLCSAYDEININIVELAPPSEYIYVPNAFTPNGDGINDRFTPAFKDELPGEYTLYIYNRWGQEIYESHDPENGWDGTMNDAQLPSDIYVFLVKYRTLDLNHNPENGIKRGTVMLVR